MKIIIFLVVISNFFPLFAQEIRTGKVIGIGQEKELRYVQIRNEQFINLNDFLSAYGEWFEIDSSGALRPKLLFLETALQTLESDISRLSNQQPIPTTGTNVIRSRIRGTFEGWTGDTIFELLNGQIWRQSRYAYRYAYRYSPNVTIINTGRGWEMQVEGVSGVVHVERIR